MKIYTITVAYCPAVLLARSLILYEETANWEVHGHIVVQGHYPINEKKNTNDIKLICEAIGDIQLLDPGKNLGSAQSQNWALSQIGIREEDYFINLDPDSTCPTMGWVDTLTDGLDKNPDCVVMSCMSPMVMRYRTIDDFDRNDKWLIPKKPSPFNLSAWRYSFIKEIGGIPQGGLWWGETEGALWSHCKAHGKYHAYDSTLMENEDGKFAQDRQHNEYKNFHMRVPDNQKFLGSFEEFLRWKYPHLLEIDTCKDLSDHNHP